MPFLERSLIAGWRAPPDENRPIAPLAHRSELSYAAVVYQPHRSQKLTEMFRAKPYQGARPESAEFIFVGLDANYAADIESSPAFPRVLEYHEDGVAFWQRHKVHHPFLLADYRGDGRRYHRNFARTGFKPEDACRVSFVELLHIPTVGSSQLVLEDLDSAHLEELNAFIQRGARRNIFFGRQGNQAHARQRAFPLAAQTYCEPSTPSVAQGWRHDDLPAPALLQLRSISGTHDT